MRSGPSGQDPQEWGDFVRAINPDYTGPRPRLQINQGNQDETVSFNNFREGIDQWTNVLGLDEMPTSTENGVQGAEATYNTQFWQDDCGYTVPEMWEAVGMGHSMGYESVDILRFFGLDQVREQDPWVEACGDSFLPPDGEGGGEGAGGMPGMGEEMGAGGGTDGEMGMNPGMPMPEPGVTPTPVTPTPDPVMPTTPAPTPTPEPGAPVAPATPVGGTPATTQPVTGTPPAAAPGAMTAPTPTASGAAPMSGGSSDSGGCSVSNAPTSRTQAKGASASLLLLGLGLFTQRRRRAAR